MKRTVTFEITDDKYSLVEDGDELFSIDRTNLQLDVKKFYQAFFAEELDYSEIEIACSGCPDKSAAHVFDTVKRLTSDICKRLKEDFSVDGSVDVPEENLDENE